MKLFLFDSTKEYYAGEKFIFESDGIIHYDKLFPYYNGKMVKRLYIPRVVISDRWLACSVRRSTPLSDPNDIMKDIL